MHAHRGDVPLKTCQLVGPAGRAHVHQLLRGSWRLGQIDLCSRGMQPADSLIKQLGRLLARHAHSCLWTEGSAELRSCAPEFTMHAQDARV